MLTLYPIRKVNAMDHSIQRGFGDVAPEKFFKRICDFMQIFQTATSGHYLKVLHISPKRKKIFQREIFY